MESCIDHMEALSRGVHMKKITATGKKAAGTRHFFTAKEKHNLFQKKKNLVLASAFSPGTANV